MTNFKFNPNQSVTIKAPVGDKKHAIYKDSLDNGTMVDDGLGRCYVATGYDSTTGEFTFEKCSKFNKAQKH